MSLKPKPLYPNTKEERRKQTRKETHKTRTLKQSKEAEANTANRNEPH
jgi:hypothetical protein